MRLIHSIFLSFLLFFLPTIVMAEGNIRLGRIEIHPSLSYDGTYDSNIYKESSNERTDWIHTITPGISLMYQGVGDNFVEIGYNLGIVRYTEYTDNNYLDHNAFLNAQYQTPMGWYVKFDDNYVNTADPYGNLNSYRQGDAKVKRWYNEAEAAVGYEHNKVRLEAGVGNHYERYAEDEDKWQNRNDMRYSMTGYYRIMPRTSLLLQYRVLDINYSNQNNGDNTQGIDSDTSQDALFHQLFVGLNFDPSGKVQGDLKVGIGRKNYSNDADWNGMDYEDITTWLVETGLTWDMSAKTQWTLDLGRSLHDSTESYATRFTTTEMELGVKHQLMTQIALLGNIAYRIDQYDDASNDSREARHDNTFAAGTGISYQPKEWLTTGIGYEFENRSCNSDFSDEEYQDHRVTLKLAIAF